MARLDAQRMISRAETATGFNDWGGEEFRVPFETLIRAINEEALLTAIGLERTERWLHSRLCERLKLFEDRKRNPAILSQRIEKPIFITGLPRAGTTYTHALLASDPAHVAPLLWQWYRSSPPPNDASIDHCKTIQEVEEFMRFQGWKSPAMMAQHDHNARAPEECFFGFELSFVNLGFTGYWHIPSYAAILPTHWTEAYQIHRKLLQAMQVGIQGRRWILKAPEHMTHFDALFTEYPDALIVQNHRDPAKVMASVLSVITTMQALYSDQVQRIDRKYGLHFMEMFAAGLVNAAAKRKDPAMKARVVDIHYLHLEREPVSVMRKLYDDLNLSFNDRSLASITGWIESNRKGKHGKHRYNLADYGLTQEDVWGAFADYLDMFEIERERV